MPLLHRQPAPHAPPSAGGEDRASDAALVLAAQRDPHAFAALFTRYWETVLRYCRIRLLDRQEAEDAASQVFVDAYAGLHRFHDRGTDGSFRAWLLTIAHHEVVNRHRYRARHPASPLDAAADVCDQTPSPEHTAIAASDMAQIVTLLRQLPARPQEVLELRLAGLTDREIASVLGISGEAVRQAQSRAVSHLRALMGIAPATEQKRHRHDPGT
jgi:RNA polymerase sigma-70 factor (ECF subfamily)